MPYIHIGYDLMHAVSVRFSFVKMFVFGVQNDVVVVKVGIAVAMGRCLEQVYAVFPGFVLGVYEALWRQNCVEVFFP